MKKGDTKFKISVTVLICLLVIGTLYVYRLFSQEVELIEESLIQGAELNLSGLYYIFIIELISLLLVIGVLIILLGYLFKLYKVAEQDSLIDHLTKIYNRKAVFHELKGEMERSERYKIHTSVALIDIDFFKKYNDTQGHVAGDKLLKRLAGFFKKYLREYDVYGRYGGEEFIIILPRTNLHDAIKICDRLRNAIQKTKFPGEHDMPNKDVTISIGVAEYNGAKKMKYMDLVNKADKNLYKAKETGRNKVVG